MRTTKAPADNSAEDEADKEATFSGSAASRALLLVEECATMPVDVVATASIEVASVPAEVVAAAVVATVPVEAVVPAPVEGKPVAAATQLVVTTEVVATEVVASEVVATEVVATTKHDGVPLAAAAPVATMEQHFATEATPIERASSSATDTAAVPAAPAGRRTVGYYYSFPLSLISLPFLPTPYNDY